MRILMLAHRMPSPPLTGATVRAYHVARHLARAHALTLAALVDEPGVESALVELRREVPDVAYAVVRKTARRLSALLSVTGGGSATMHYFNSADLHAQVASRIADTAPDLIYVSSSSMAQYLPGTREIPIIMDFVDVDSEKWLQYARRLQPPRNWLYRLEGLRLRRHEIAAARRASRSVVVTPVEEALLHSFAPWAPVSVVPNGVDLGYFTPAPTRPTTPVIVFTGAMDYFPNVDAATYFHERVFPSIRHRVPGARFIIAGKNPVPRVRRLASAEGVEVTGTVGDIRPFLREAAVAVAPLRMARGVQNKVLEAMAMGLPVVATSAAYAGLCARPGQHLLVEDDPARFADTTVQLLHTAELRTRIGRAARQFVETHHSWAASMVKLDHVLAEVVQRQSRFAGIQAGSR